VVRSYPQLIEDERLRSETQFVKLGLFRTQKFMTS